tara:strand:+ start:91 stop:324 length:234 start_codon:yes stop_codon:yes gene_type:complete
MYLHIAEIPMHLSIIIGHVGGVGFPPGLFGVNGCFLVMLLLNLSVSFRRLAFLTSIFNDRKSILYQNRQGLADNYPA